MSKVYTTRSFKIPADFELKMNQKLVADGYGLRGKSKWICDSIVNLLTFSDQEFVMDCIEYADEFENLNKSMSFRPTVEAEHLLNDWVVKARTKMPTLEGVKSKIIRASIIQAILESVKSLNKMAIIQNDNG